MLQVFNCFAIGFIVALTMPSVVHSQGRATVDFELTNDRAVLEGFGAVGIDVLGIRPGEKHADVVATLGKEFPGAKIEETTTDYSVSDGKGSSIAFKYTSRVKVSAATEYSREVVVVYLTTILSGSRAYQVSRRVEYFRGKQPERGTFFKALEEKYGQPSISVKNDNHRSRDLYYSWEGRQRQIFPEIDIQAIPIGRPSPSPHYSVPCVSLIDRNPYAGGDHQLGTSSHYIYANSKSAVAETRFNSCVGAMRAYIILGTNDNTIGQADFTLTDYVRAREDARLLNETVDRLLAAKAAEERGVTKKPRL